MQPSIAGQHNDGMDDSRLHSGKAAPAGQVTSAVVAPPASAIGAQPARAPLPAVVRWALLALALLSLGLAILGVFLPVLPTVPFVLLAAWAAARSSPKLDAWLVRHPRLGPILVDWRQGGRVPRRAKWMATALMGLSAASLLVMAPRHWLPYAAIACMDGAGLAMAPAGNCAALTHPALTLRSRCDQAGAASRSRNPCSSSTATPSCCAFSSLLPASAPATR